MQGSESRQMKEKKANKLSWGRWQRHTLDCLDCQKLFLPYPDLPAEGKRINRLCPACVPMQVDLQCRKACIILFFFFKAMLYIEHFTLRKLPSGMKSSWSITSKIQIGPKVITAQTPNVLLTCSTQLVQSRLLVDTLTDSQKANNQFFFFSFLF